MEEMRAEAMSKVASKTALQSTKGAALLLPNKAWRSTTPRHFSFTSDGQTRFETNSREQHRKRFLVCLVPRVLTIRAQERPDASLLVSNGILEGVKHSARPVFRAPRTTDFQ